MDELKRQEAGPPLIMVRVQGALGVIGLFGWGLKGFMVKGFTCLMLCRV